MNTTPLLPQYWLSDTRKVQVQTFSTLSTLREIPAPWGDKAAQDLAGMGWETQKGKGM